MKLKKLVIAFWVAIMSTSCIPTQDLIYLNKKEQKEVQAEINEVKNKPYRLQVNDLLSITIKTTDPKYSSIFSPSAGENNQQVGRSATGLYFDGYTVDDHGNIRIPILGEINVLGYTLEDTRKMLEKRLLSEYFNKEANLFVSVKLSGFNYTVNGEVGRTGTITLFKDQVNIMEAIANAGDITLTGDRKHVMIIRQTPTGTEMHTLDLTDANVIKSPYYFLQPNDYIYVKPLKQKSWGTGTTGVQSLGTIITVLSLFTTTLLLLKK